MYDDPEQENSCLQEENRENQCVEGQEGSRFPLVSSLGLGAGAEGALLSSGSVHCHFERTGENQSAVPPASSRSCSGSCGVTRK